MTLLPQTLIDTTPRADLREWVEGGEMDCPRCGDHVLEGDDCQAEDFAAIGELVLDHLVMTDGGPSK